MIAVDFSFSRFTVAELHAAGITAVCRYLTGAGKAITAAELQADLAAGIAVVLVFENGANDASGGFAAGAANARAANAALLALGLPTSTPVYFAADTDYPNPGAAVPYWQGLASVRPSQTNGAYAEGALLDVLFADWLAGFGWESESTSFPGSGALSPNAALWQKVGGAPLAGTDLDLIEKADYGQLPRPSTPAPPAPTTKGADVLSDLVQYKPGQIDFFQISPAGDPYHKWSDNDGVTWTSEPLPSLIKFAVAKPVVRVSAAGCEVYVEDAGVGRVFRYFQAVAGATWSVSELP